MSFNTTAAGASGATAPEKPEIALHYEALNEGCRSILVESLAGDRCSTHGESHAFVADLSNWIESIRPRRESLLLSQSCKEYQYSLLHVVQGQYRQSFASLRLHMELALSAVYYSAHEVLLREWLQNRRDNHWRRITTSSTGVFSTRFAKAFAPEIADEAVHYGSIAGKVYRECSEFVHGNPEASAKLPQQLAFDARLFDSWHEKASSVRTVLTFFLFLRYGTEFDSASRTKLEPSIREHLGHIASVRRSFQDE